MPSILTTAFQFHKGAIETSRSSHPCEVYALFQFHKGAIETRTVRSILGASLTFNSIKVRLKLHRGATISNRCITFNSIKVRLKRSMDRQVQRKGQVFQFHKGAIETLRYWQKWKHFQTFNSIKVRLKRVVLGNANSLFTTRFCVSKVTIL